MKTALLVAVCMVLACGTAFGDEPCGGLWGWNGARVGHDGLGLWWEWWPTDGFAFVSPAVRDVISGSVDETDSAWVVLHNGSVWFMGSEDYAPEQVKRQVGSTVGVFANAKSISHPLVLDADGDVWQIGANMVATKISGLSGIKKVVAAREQYLALNTMGKAYAWGNNSGGQCGVGSDAEVIAGPQLVDETWGLNGVVMDIADSG